MDELKKIKKISRAAGKLLGNFSKKRVKKPKKAKAEIAAQKKRAKVRAKELSAVRRSEKTIEEMKSKGFQVSEEIEKALKKVREQKRVLSENEWEDWKKKYGSGALKRKATYQVDRVQIAGHGSFYIDSFDTGIKYSEITSDKGLARVVNRLRTTKVPVPDYTKEVTSQGWQPMQMRHVLSHEEGSYLGEIVYLLTGANPATGMVTDFFEIDDSYDPSKPHTLAEHINFKKLPSENEDLVDLILQYSELAYTNRGLWDEYMKKRQKRAGEKILDDMGVDEDTRALLAMILESSQMYSICSREAPPSEAAEQAYAHLTKICEEAQKTSSAIFYRIVAMILADPMYDYDDIVYEFKRMIAELRQGQIIDDTSEG